jgi:hypothetical protein
LANRNAPDVGESRTWRYRVRIHHPFDSIVAGGIGACRRGSQQRQDLTRTVGGYISGQRALQALDRFGGESLGTRDEVR